MADNDFSFETGNWGEAISTLKSASQAMTEVADAMKQTVLNALLDGGLTGDTARVLSERYDADVLKSIRTFSDELQLFIAKNEANYQRAEELNAETTRIANG